MSFNTHTCVTFEPPHGTPLMPEVTWACFGEGCWTSPDYALPTDLIDIIGFLDSDTCGRMLENIPMMFMRLGVESRRLVLSLYYAILERFFVMRSTGGRGCNQIPPATFPGGGFNSFVGRYLGSCHCVSYCASVNPRRIFGGVFREAFEGVLDELKGNDCTRTFGGVTFYPPTPHKEICFPGSDFYENFVHRDPDSIEWSKCGPYRSIESASYSYLRDWTQRKQSPLVKDCRTLSRDDKRPLFRAFVRAYRDVKMPDADLLCWAFSNLVCDELDWRSEPTGNWHCNRDHTGNPFIVEHGDVVAGFRFNLSALALALRILSVWHTQTVQRGARLSIPHVVIKADRELAFQVNGEPCVDCAETRDFSCSRVYLDKVNAGIKTSYIGGFARVCDVGWVDSWGRYVTSSNNDPEQTRGAQFGGSFGDGLRNSEISGDEIIPSSCWGEWPSFVCHYECSNNAEAHFCAIWPCFTHEDEDFCHSVSMSADLYPAQWALINGLVAHMLLTVFVSKSNTCCTAPGNYGFEGTILRAYEYGGDYRNLSTSCDFDVMRKMADRIIDTVMMRIVHDANCVVRSDDVDADVNGKLLCFPISGSEAFGDLGYAPDICAIRCSIDCGAACSVGDIRIHCGRPQREIAGTWFDLDTACDGRWWRVWTQRKSINFRYDHGGKRCNSAFWAWTTGTTYAQFGGFFGTFTFQNSMAKQTT